jgi:hypothetical protein
MAIAYQPLKLPSLGQFYDGKIPDGAAEVRYFTTKEEELLGRGGDARIMINALLAACVRLPGNFPHDELLITDRMAALLAVRVLSYGSSYNFRFRCSACGQQTSGTVDLLGDLTTKNPDPALTEPIPLVLPITKIPVFARFLRGVDEEAIVKYAKRMKQASEAEGGDPSSIHRLARQMVKIGDKDLPILEREVLIRDLPMADTVAFRNTMDDLESGIDLTVRPTCKMCSAENELQMPFDLEFFRPSSLHAGRA